MRRDTRLVPICGQYATQFRTRIRDSFCRSRTSIFTFPYPRIGRLVEPAYTLSPYWALLSVVNLLASLKMWIVVPESRIDEFRNGYSPLEARKAAAFSEMLYRETDSQLDFSNEFLTSF